MKVYTHHRRFARQWNTSMSASTNNAQSVTWKVFWQAFWYLMCFYVTWPIVVMISSFIDDSFYEAYWFLWLAMLVAPLQGLLSFVN